MEANTKRRGVVSKALVQPKGQVMLKGCRETLFHQREAAGASTAAASLRAAGSVGLLQNDISHPDLPQ